MHVLNTVVHTGNGIANVAVDLAVEQRRRGHEVAVASAGGGFVDLLRENSVLHHHLDFTSRRPKALITAHRGLATLVDRTRPEVVHAHTITPTVVGAVVQRRRPFTLVATVHNEYQRGVTLMRTADAVVGVSEAVSASMVRRGVPRARIHTVLNGTVGSPRRTAPSPEDVVHLPPDAIVTVGAVSHRKGADVLVAAFEEVVREFPGAQLYFVGNVDWTELAEGVAAGERADQVHFVGFDAQPQRYFPTATVFVLASRRDPMPLVLLEALEAGLPVVASDVDGIPEALDGGRAGLLARPEDPTDLAAKTISLLRSEDLRRRLGAAAKERVATLTVAAMTERYLEVYGITSS
nr:glycosyltransferase family 4 protein [Geodermatophilus normandii]